MLERVGFAALLAHASDHGSLDANDHVRTVVELLDHPHDILDVGLGGMRLHYDDHVMGPLALRNNKASARTSASQGLFG